MPFKNPHPLYSVWRSMIERCRRTTAKQWNDYGGRGISVCERWGVFANFLEDMGPRPDGYSLDRIDNDGNYDPSNCRWSSKKEQQRNRRDTRYVVIEGKEYIAAELTEKHGIKADTIVSRAALGMTYAEVVAKTRYLNLKGLALGGNAFGAKQRAKTHCRNGHAYSPENTKVDVHGWRHCRTCRT